MHTLASDEKLTKVMVYSRNKLIHGDVVTKETVKVSVWLRTEGVPNYIHLLKTEILFFGGAAPKSVAYNEYFFPKERIIGFHLAPPNAEPPDYQPDEQNRQMADVQMMLGAFMLKGKLRISMQTDVGKSIDVLHATWLSVYEADIVNPFVPSMPTIHVPFLLVDPKQVSFGI